MMTLAVRRAWDPFRTVLDREFEDLVHRSFGTRETRGFVPAANLVRDGSDVLIELELPGIDPDDVDVEVSDGRLVVSGRRTEETTEDERSGVLVREIRTGAFRREFALPEGVDSERIDASYERGVLKVRVRDAARESSPQKIEIRSAE